MCQHCKQLGRILSTSGVRLTGRTQRLVSPLTGEWTTYHETYGIYVTTPAPASPDLDGIREQINTDLYGQSVDGFCDEMLIIQGVFQDTYKPRVWYAEDQPALQARSPSLIAPIIIAAIIIGIAVIAVAIAVIAVVFLVSKSFTTIAQWILQPPSYVGGTPENPESYDNFAEYCSSQNNLYWYTCPKCCAGFGSKLDYPNIEDVPQAEVDRFNEHVENCLGIPKGPQNIDEFLIWTVIGVGTVVAIVFVIGPALTKTAEKGVTVVVPKT